MYFSVWDSSLVSDEPIRNIKAGNFTMGFEFKMQYPTYRGTYLSCIEKLDIWLDGKAVDPASIVFILNNKEMLLKEFPDLYKEYWFRLDKAIVRIYQSKGLVPGSKHQIRVRILHRIPYARFSLGNYMTPENSFERELKAI